MARKTIDVLVAAAGSGTRFRGYKQFHLIGDKPILIYTLQTLQFVDEIKKIIIVVPPTMSSRVRRMVKKFHIARIGGIIVGGRRRIDSVRCGLRSVKTKTVIIHDAVRPMASYNLYRRLIKVMRSHNAVIPVIPIRDTVKSVTRGYISQTIPRIGLYLSQTPQGFNTDMLRQALRRVKDLDYTDEAAVLESAKIPVKTIRGEVTNIKITEHSDLSLLRKIL